MASWQELTRQLAAWLEAKGVLNFEAGVGGDTFTERLLPANPDNAVGIRTTGGFESSIDRPEDNPTIQVLSRATTAQAAIDKAWAIYNVLHGARYQELTEGGIFMLYAIAQQSGPVFVEQDAGGRYVYSTNYRLETHAPTAQRGG